MANKTYIGFVLDASESMLQGKHYAQGLEVLSMIATQLITKDSKTTELGLVTCGEFSRNRRIELNRVSAASLQQFEEIESSCEKAFHSRDIQENIAHRNLIEGMREAQEMLLTKKLTATASRVMVVMSDCVNGSADFEKHLRKLIPQLQENKCAVYAIIMTSSSTNELMNYNQRLCASLLREVATLTSGRYIEASDINECLPIFASAPGLTTTPRLTKINLQVSPNLIIPCTYFGLVTKVPLPSLKKQAKSSLAPTATAETAVANDEGPDIGGGDFAGLVKRDTSYRNPDDPDEEVFAEDRVKGFKYGSQYIPISGTEEEAFKVVGPALIEVLGFISANTVPRHHFLDGTTIVQGDSSSACGLAATVSVAAIATAMRTTGNVALVRFVKKENADPIMAALMPASFPNGTLLLHRLPFVEDYRDYSFPSLPTQTGASNTKISSAQFSAMSSFIDSITIASPSALQLCPFNPALRAVQTALAQKLKAAITGVKSEPKQRQDSCPDPFESVIEKSLKLSSGQEFGSSVRSVELFEKLMTDFPLVRREVKDDKKRSYWSDIRVDSSESNKRSRDGIVQISIGDDFESQQARGGVSASSVIMTTYSGPVLSASSVTPVDDFNAVIDYCQNQSEANSGDRSELSSEVAKAMDTLEKIVSLQVTVGGTPAHLRKAVACYKVYRAAAIRCGQCTLYNTFLANSKQLYAQGRYKAVWTLLQEEPTATVTLISSAEDSRSSVSPMDASQFFAANIAVVAPVVAEAPSAPEDDLFEDMA